MLSIIKRVLAPGARAPGAGRHPDDAPGHLARRTTGRLKYRAGSETGMGAFIGDIEPEAAAVRLRAALVGLG